MKPEDLVYRADQILKMADIALKSKFERLREICVLPEAQKMFRASSLSFLASTFGEAHIYYTDFDALVVEETEHDIRKGKGILQAARLELLAGGWLTTTKGLISGEIFADFLEMAEHLLEEGYKDPAAVVAGSVLEEHLRQLCQRNGITIALPDGRPKKADTLNAELAKAGVYGKLEQKEVTFWQDLRNNAAHGHYDKYTKDHVARMRQGILNFMTCVPA